jgi:ferredoxin
MGLFIKLQIDEASCLGVRKCGLCIKVCPVKIFKDNDGRPVSIEDNEDECTLCSLCLNECKPNAVRLRKMYEPETESR